MTELERLKVEAYNAMQQVDRWKNILMQLNQQIVAMEAAQGHGVRAGGASIDDLLKQPFTSPSIPGEQ